MKKLTFVQHRSRIENINAAEHGNRKYLYRHRIRDYLPGQAVYNLGDYPAKFSIEPTEYDYHMLKDMAEHGVELIQLHEEWNDSIRRFGADKFSSHDPDGLHHFIDLCHSFGIKIIPYISSGYLHEYDPDFREQFTQRVSYCINGMYFKYRNCSASCAEWREFILPHTFQVLDRYAFDGIYNDWGMDSTYKINGYLEKGEFAAYDPDAEDLLSTIYTEVKRRGGVYKLHCDRNNGAPCLDRVYDYLWIGECVKDTTVGVGKEFLPYVVPCQDKARDNLTPLDEYFASVIPFMQFPLLTTRGRPVTSKRIEQDVPYYGNDDSPFGWIEYDFSKRVGEYMKEHPDGPYSYSLWSAVPDNPDEYGIWCRYLDLYRPMVEENSVAYIELRDCADVLSPLPQDVYASMFVNEERYLVVSNMGDTPYELRLKDTWIDRENGTADKSFIIAPKRILFLKVRQSKE